MANSLFPAFVRIFYHSVYAPHVATIPTLAWNDVLSSGGSGEFDTHAASTVDADSMINDLVDALADIYPNTGAFDSYIIYTVPSIGADPQPRASKVIGTAGAVSTGGWNKAVQNTYTWRTDAFGLFKLVLLDCNSANNFDKVSVVSGGTLATLDALVTSSVLGWAGRDNGQPDTFVSQTTDLNDALRKRYRMA